MPVCATCGKRNQQGNVFCAFCGATLSDSPGAAPAPGVASGPRTFPSTGIQAEGPSLLVQIAAVFGVCALVSLVFGRVLGLPAQIIRGILPTGTCTNEVPGTFGMYLCSMKVGMVTVVGPILIMVVIFLLRKPLFAAVPMANERIPSRWQFLLPPVVAAAAFTMSWAGYHVQTWNKTGIMPHSVFPAVIGLFTYAVARFGPEIAHTFESYFHVRDGIPRFLRYVLVIAVPLTVALIITFEERVSNEALKEQFIVLVGLIVAYLLVSPRPDTGPLGAAVGAARAGGGESRLGGWLLCAIPVGALVKIACELVAPDLVLAHDCSSEGDCQQTPGYNAATGVGGGAVGAGAGLLGVQIAGTALSTGAAAAAVGDDDAPDVDADADTDSDTDLDTDTDDATGAPAPTATLGTTRIIDGAAATNWMVNQGLLNPDGTPTPLFTAWQNDSLGPNATRLDGFAGNMDPNTGGFTGHINPDTGRWEGDFAIVVRDPDTILHDRPPAPTGDEAVIVTENFAPGIDITGTHQFIEQTRLHLQLMQNRASGDDLTRRLGLECVGGGHRVNIVETNGGNSVEGFTDAAQRQPDGSRGSGSSTTLHFNPYRHSVPGASVLRDGSPDPSDWRNRPPQVGLQHELNHSYHAASGQIDLTPAPNVGVEGNVPSEELRTLGIGPFGSTGVDENVARVELGLPPRAHY
ncbi:MAG: hypothetical protein JXA58_03365 [Dehalococcoidia bacterium]|nr:hypothetical protein [Dehalococcoidia bacterium]